MIDDLDSRLRGNDGFIACLRQVTNQEKEGFCAMSTGASSY